MTASRLLVVGGAGFVGSNLVRLLLSEGAERVLVVDNLLSSERENLPTDPRVELVQASIADDDVLSSLADEFDAAYHLATYHGNQSSIANPLEDHENNLITTLKLYERLKGFRRLRKVVYSASGCTLAPHEVYEGAQAVSEEGPVPLDLDSPYQISKVVGEFYSVYYHRQHGLPTVRARFQNVYGPGEVLGAGRWRGTPATVWRNVTPAFVYRALENLPLQLENGGVASRDFVYVEDVARGLLACAEHGESGEVYNLASGVETTIRSLAELIVELSGSSSELEIAPRRPWDHSVLRFGSPEKARRELGFEATVSLEEGLRRTIAWMRENLEFVKSCIAKHAEQERSASVG
ncbi:MAG TPA: NAD-dependent epimerase/dehydratase family protein [Acidimicrobiales bacterium]|nr:NAD-dependent epimerase/dehydratase family protein [Acidimicrobiales bacterium]